MALHDIMRITIPARVMGKPHIIRGVGTSRQGTPHTMVLLAIEPMAIASLSLTTIVRLSAPGLHPKAILPLVSGLLTPEVLTLRIDALTTSGVMNRTVTTTVRHKTTKDHHKDVALTSALRNITKDVPMVTATIARNQIGNILVAIVIIAHNAIRSATEVEDIPASTKGQHTTIRSRENSIHVSRVGRRHFKDSKETGDQRTLRVLRLTKNNSKVITSILVMILPPRQKQLRGSPSEGIDLIVMSHTRITDHDSYNTRTPSFVQVSMKMQKNSSIEFTHLQMSTARFGRRLHPCQK
jgi:hypothetical protein